MMVIVYNIWESMFVYCQTDAHKCQFRSKAKDNLITHLWSARTCPIIVHSVGFNFGDGKWKYLEANKKIWADLHHYSIEYPFCTLKCEWFICFS